MSTEARSRCPVCASPTEIRLVLPVCPILSCTNCSHQFAAIETTEQHLQEQYGDDYFCGGGTAGYADYLASKDLVTQHGSRYAAIVDSHWSTQRVRENRRMLDIGCAAGFLMDGFRQSGWDVTGVDPNAAMVGHAVASGMTAYESSFENLLQAPAGLNGRQAFDLLCLVQVIAHLTDLRSAAQTLAELVSDDGFVLVETWNSASLSARLLGANWHEYSPPNVLHYFSKKSLDQLLDGAGFDCIAGGRPAKEISMGHGRSLFRYKYGDYWWGKALLQMSRPFSDNFSVPYPSEDLFWRLYRKRAPQHQARR